MARWLSLSADDGHEFSAYQSKSSPPSSKGQVVVVQEIFGVNRHIRDVCDRFSHNGYDALAPSLFDRLEDDVQLDYTADDVEKGRSLRSRLDWNDALKDTLACVHYLAESGPVAVVGFCYGGTLAWLAASTPQVQATVCYYGSYIHQFKDRNPRCPVLLHFGALDDMIPMQSIADIKAANSGSPPEILIYPEAGHGFNCNYRNSFHEPSAEQAWQRTLEFLSQNLARV